MIVAVQVYTLFRTIGFEWARVLFIRVLVTGVGCDARFNGSDALTWFPAQILEALAQQRHEQKHV